MTDFVSGTVLTAAALDTAFNQVALNDQTGTSYTFVFSDQGGMVTFSNAASVAVTVPTNAAVAFPVGTTILLLQKGAGQVVVAGAGGVTVNGTPGKKMRTQWSVASLIQYSANAWVMSGDVVA